MNFKYSSSGLFVGVAFVLATSCGGSSKNDEPGSGVGGASAGAPSASGTGGSGAMSGDTSASGGPSGGASTGGAGKGAMGGAGGMSGKGNFGCPAEKPEEGGTCMRAANFPACTYDDGGCVCANGAWDCYTSSDCPATAPDDAAACTLGGMQCAYDGLACTCSAMDGWSCESPCPAMTPADAASCRRDAARTCRYAEGAVVQGFGMADTTCSCNGGSFTCFSQEDCPASAPENASACEFATLGCEYADRDCTCTNGAWSCTTDCPESLPSDGALCLRPPMASCRYLEGAVVQGFGGKSDTTCLCEDEAFNCFGQEDCPAAAPTSGTACEFATLSCAYTGVQCTCDNAGMWNCTTECPAEVPMQDSACSRPEQATCRYNEGALAQGFGPAEAICACREQKFDCLTQADCPADAPENQAACTDFSNLSCNYADRQCTCGPNGWNCQSECPAQLPAASAACLRPATAPCRYTGGALVEMGTEAENTCVCVDDAFSCYSAADCPAAAPEANSMCDKPGLSCTIDGQSCRCRTSTSTWTCGGGGPPTGTGGAGTAGSGTAGTATAGGGTGGGGS